MFLKKLFPLILALTFATLAAATFEEEFAAIEKTDFKRDLVLRTELVRGGKPAAVIAAPAGLAECAKIVADAVFAKTGVRLPKGSCTLRATAPPLPGYFASRSE